jgi:murein DD-endopeptidase MepM/ murein hydrolase activator NlpD
MNKLLLLCCLCLPLRHIQVTSPYGYRVHPLTGKYSFHAGVDLRAFRDTVFAVLDGTVQTVGYNNLLGLYICLDHGNFQSIYGHLSEAFIFSGDTVLAGEAIAVSGETGRVTGSHLHFEVRFHQHCVDPLRFLKALATRSTPTFYADTGTSAEPGHSRRLP